MIADFLANHHTMFEVNDSFKHMNQIMSHKGIKELSAGDSAEWAAGVMYAFTGQTVDVRDALVECSTEVDKLDLRLGKAYKRYGNSKFVGGNKAIVRSEQWFRESMANCDEDIMEQFEAMVGKAYDFFDADGWQDVVHENYTAHKDDFNVTWEDMMKTWGYDDFFGAGMFYGRAWNILTKGSVI